VEEKQKFWNPYVAGFALGLVLLASFVLTGRGLGASGTFKHLGAAALHALSPTWTEENANVAAFFSDPRRSSLDDWIVWLTLGSVIGAAVAVFTARRFVVETVHGPRARVENRWILAVAGGVVSGFAAQLARGCTSGQALTGGAQLAAGSWVFMMAVFAGAYGLAWFVRKQWV
jgi:hypothetical protein